MKVSFEYEKYRSIWTRFSFFFFCFFLWNVKLAFDKVLKTLFNERSIREATKNKELIVGLAVSIAERQ